MANTNRRRCLPHQLLWVIRTFTASETQIYGGLWRSPSKTHISSELLLVPSWYLLFSSAAGRRENVLKLKRRGDGRARGITTEPLHSHSLNTLFSRRFLNPLFAPLFLLSSNTKEETS